MNQLVDHFLKQVLSEVSYRLAPLHGDGSERRFYRVWARGETYILLEHLDNREENQSYLRIGRHMHDKGVPVPRIYAHDERGLFLLEDLGDEHLMARAKGLESRSLEQLYRKAVDLLVLMQERATKDFEEKWCYDTPRYDRRLALEKEGRYFLRALLGSYLGWEELPRGIEGDLVRLSALVDCESRRVILHRDFQSRNIMIKQGRLYLIDFQGARLGPPQYDLASLLWDPYVTLPSSLREGLFDYYLRQAEAKSPGFKENFTAIALHRSMQVLGAFGFLSMVKMKPFFAQYIPAAVNNLLDLVRGLDTSPYPSFEEVLRKLQGLYGQDET